LDYDPNLQLYKVETKVFSDIRLHLMSCSQQTVVKIFWLSSSHLNATNQEL